MRILFINFNIGSTPGINNGLACLSAVLKEKKHEVGLIFLCEQLGYNLDLARIKDDINAAQPDIIGISLMETQLKYANELLKAIRGYYKGFVICGGPYPTMDPEECLKLEGVDAVCIGEGEDAMVELAERLGLKQDCKNIRNLWVKTEAGIIRNKLRPFKDLNELPPEDKELFDLEKILPLKNYQLEDMVGRGCAYRCSYCINESYLKKYKQLCERPISMKDYIRFKDIVTAIREIKDAVNKHPEIRKIAFIDDNFMVDEGFLGELCASYKKNINLPFMCNVNPICYSLAKAKILKKAGCDDVRFGIESGSERVKKEILRRPIPNTSVVRAFEINKKLDMMTSSFNMIGLPTETREEVLETLRLNASILPDTIKVMTFYPFKNTPLYDLCEEMDLIDYEKKSGLDNYDTFTCLKFPQEHQLFLRNIQTAFNWYINLFLGHETSSEYAKLTDQIERMDEDEWNRFNFYSADEEASLKMRNKGLVHYSKFMNRSLAVKFPSRHISE